MNKKQWNSSGNVVMFEVGESNSLKFHREHCHFRSWWIKTNEFQFEILSFSKLVNQNHSNSGRERKMDNMDNSPSLSVAAAGLWTTIFVSRSCAKKSRGHPPHIHASSRGSNPAKSGRTRRQSREAIQATSMQARNAGLCRMRCLTKRRARCLTWMFFEDDRDQKY